MDIFQEMERSGHEQLVFCFDRSTGLKCLIGIHDTTLGPALGGCRMWPYQSEGEAVTDVLRLAKGMTYKNAAMGLDLGGGKAVVLAQPGLDREEVFRAVGRFIATLGGRYITAEDVGTATEDMAIIARETQHVTGLKGRSGDPSAATAFGVFVAIKACLREVFGSEEVRGRTVAVQGLGHVGTSLADRLAAEGAQLVVADIDGQKAKELEKRLGARRVDPDAIFDVPADVLAPCALGAVLNDDTIPRLKVRVVAGSANNQLQEPRHARLLADRGILYAPDFIVNGGGVINVAEEINPQGYSRERALAKVATIYDRLLALFRQAKAEGILPVEAANRLAEDRIRAAGGRMFVPHGIASP